MSGLPSYFDAIFIQKCETYNIILLLCNTFQIEDNQLCIVNLNIKK